MVSPSQPPEQELALLLATGQGASPHVVEALIRTYSAELEMLLRVLTSESRTGSDHTEELLPVIFFQAIQNAQSIERNNSVRAWLFANTIKSWQAMGYGEGRAQSLIRRLSAFLPREAELRSSGTEEKPNLVFDQLGDKARLVVALRYVFSMPLELVSEILETSEQAILDILRTARQPFLPAPFTTARHPSHEAARRAQTELQEAFDLAPDLGATPVLKDHLIACDDCTKLYRNLMRLDQQISSGLRSRWPYTPLSEPEIRTLSSRTLSLIEAQEASPPNPWPLKELAGLLFMVFLVLAVFRLLTPVVVDYPPTPTPALLPSQLLEIRPAAGSPPAVEPEAINYLLSKTLIGGTTVVNVITYSPNGDLLVSGSRDNLVRVWGGANESNLIVLRGHMSQVTSLGFSPDGTFLASGDAQGVIRIWDPINQFQYSNLDNTPGPIRSLAFSPDGNLLAVGTAKSLWLWVVNKQSFVRVFEYPGEEITSISFSPFGDILALADKKTVYIRRIRDGQLLLKYENHTDTVLRVVFSPDGNWLASGGMDQTVNIAQINPRSDGSIGAEIVYSISLDSEVNDVAFSKDGSLLAATTKDGDLSIHFMADGDLAQVIPGGGQFVRFSPIDNSLASIGGDGLIRLWEPVEGGKDARSQ